MNSTRTARRCGTVSNVHYRIVLVVVLVLESVRLASAVRIRGRGRGRVGGRGRLVLCSALKLRELFAKLLGSIRQEASTASRWANGQGAPFLHWATTLWLNFRPFTFPRVFTRGYSWENRAAVHKMQHDLTDVYASRPCLAEVPLPCHRNSRAAAHGATDGSGTAVARGASPCQQSPALAAVAAPVVRLWRAAACAGVLRCVRQWRSCTDL